MATGDEAGTVCPRESRFGRNIIQVEGLGADLRPQHGRAMALVQALAARVAPRMPCKREQGCLKGRGRTSGTTTKSMNIMAFIPCRTTGVAAIIEARPNARGKGACARQAAVAAAAAAASATLCAGWGGLAVLHENAKSTSHRQAGYAASLSVSMGISAPSHQSVFCKFRHPLLRTALAAGATATGTAQGGGFRGPYCFHCADGRTCRRRRRRRPAACPRPAGTHLDSESGVRSAGGAPRPQGRRPPVRVVPAGARDSGRDSGREDRYGYTGTLPMPMVQHCYCRHHRRHAIATWRHALMTVMSAGVGEIRHANAMRASVERAPASRGDRGAVGLSLSLSMPLCEREARPSSAQG